MTRRGRSRRACTAGTTAVAALSLLNSHSRSVDRGTLHTCSLHARRTSLQRTRDGSRRASPHTRLRPPASAPPRGDSSSPREARHRAPEAQIDHRAGRRLGPCVGRLSWPRRGEAAEALPLRPPDERAHFRPHELTLAAASSTGDLNPACDVRRLHRPHIGFGPVRGVC
jgi:hypothetical protein